MGCGSSPTTRDCLSCVVFFRLPPVIWPPPLRAIIRRSHRGAFDRIHLHKAAALEGLGQDLAALGEWTLAMRRDPELPEAYLGQARLAIRLKFWDLALADLEQAAAWAPSDPPTELAITAAYLKCLPSQPNRLARWLALASRTYGDFRMTIFR